MNHHIGNVLRGIRRHDAAYLLWLGAGIGIAMLIAGVLSNLVMHSSIVGLLWLGLLIPAWMILAAGIARHALLKRSAQWWSIRIVFRQRRRRMLRLYAVLIGSEIGLAILYLIIPVLMVIGLLILGPLLTVQIGRLWWESPEASPPRLQPLQWLNMASGIWLMQISVLMAMAAIQVIPLALISAVGLIVLVLLLMSIVPLYSMAVYATVLGKIDQQSSLT
jgi:MFS family permease